MKKYVAYLNEKFNREKIEKNNELPKETFTNPTASREECGNILL